jgi:hypothetical protein
MNAAARFAVALGVNLDELAGIVTLRAKGKK